MKGREKSWRWRGGPLHPFWKKCRGFYFNPFISGQQKGKKKGGPISRLHPFLSTLYERKEGKEEREG